MPARRPLVKCILFEAVEGLLEDLPVLLAGHFLLRGGVEGGFEPVLAGTTGLVEYAEISRKRRVGQFVGGHFVGDIVAGGNEVGSSAK